MGLVFFLAACHRNEASPQPGSTPASDRFFQLRDETSGDVFFQVPMRNHAMCAGYRRSFERDDQYTDLYSMSECSGVSASPDLPVAARLRNKTTREFLDLEAVSLEECVAMLHKLTHLARDPSEENNLAVAAECAEKKGNPVPPA